MKEILTIENFYLNLRREFPKLNDLTIWKDWNWKNESDVHCVIISAIAREMISWTDSGNIKDTIKMLGFVENALLIGSNTLVSYIGTDFTVTIIEYQNKDIREMIKSLLGPLTRDAYSINLKGYKEPN